MSSGLLRHLVRVGRTSRVGIAAAFHQISRQVSGKEAQTTKSVRPYEDIPGPSSFEVFCSMFRRNVNPIDDFNNLQRTFGDILKLKAGPMQVVMVADPDMVATMHRHEGKYPVRGAGIEMENFYCKKYGKTNTLATLEGEDWHTPRYRVQPTLLKPRSAIPFLPGQCAVANDFMKRMRRLLDSNNEIPNYDQELFKYAVEVCVLGFDKRLGCLDDTPGPLYEEAMALVQSVSKMMQCTDDLLKPLPMALFKLSPQLSPVFRRYIKAANQMHRVKDNFLQEAFGKLKSNDVQDKPRFLNYMINEEKMPPYYADIIITSFFVAGVDSTGNTLAWMLYNLAKNPEQQDKLREELQTLPKDGELPEDAFNNMPYLKACLKETFRILPPFGAGTPRVMPEDSVIGGYHIPKGTQVIPLVQQMAKSEKYFSEPQRFLPERWVRGDTREDIHPFLLLPFGHGPRSCLGRRFAEQEIYLAITRIIQHFKVEYHYENFGYKFQTFIRPDKPLNFTFIPL